VLLGLLAVQIAADLHLNPGQKGLMTAIPLLAGLIGQVIVIAGLTRLKSCWRRTWGAAGVTAARV